jgi:predicted HicB family RNase H-like nuclease
MESTKKRKKKEKKSTLNLSIDSKVKSKANIKAKKHDVYLSQIVEDFLYDWSSE